MEVIPFSVFMAKPVTLPFSVASVMPTFHLPITEGYIFFGALGAILLGITFLEKYTSIKINENNIKVGMFLSFLVGLGWLVAKHSFFRHLFLGF